MHRGQGCLVGLVYGLWRLSSSPAMWVWHFVTNPIVLYPLVALTAYNVLRRLLRRR
jgi:hypothetical protein